MSGSLHPRAVCHSSSVIDPSCFLSEGVEIGPFCIVGEGVRIGDRTRLLSHVTITGSTSIGKDCVVHPHAVLGGQSQGRGTIGGNLSIGDSCTIRESVTANVGTGGTTIGNNVLLMAGSHVAHDCKVHDDVILVNGAALAGHVTVYQGAIVAGLSAVVQHCTIGEFSYIGAGTVVSRDVLPFSMVKGYRGRTTGINVVGLKRRGWDDERIRVVGLGMQMFLHNDNEGLQLLLANPKAIRDIQRIMDFSTGSEKGFCLPGTPSIEPKL